MADPYIELPITTDAAEMVASAFERIQTVYPDWEPNDANLDVLQLMAIAEMAEQNAIVAADMPKAAFRAFGKLAGVPPIDASPASANSTWTVKDNAGYTIYADTIVGIPNGSDLIPFAVQSDVIIPAGSVATAAGAVVLVAVNEGADGDGLPGPPTLIDSLDYVTGVALTAPTSGGADAEDDDVYLERLVAELQLLTPRPILPRDFAVLARTVPGVYRATAIDGYIPGPPILTNQPRAVSVAVVDVNGVAVAANIKNAVAALLGGGGSREVNFIVNVIDPTYTTIAVTYTLTAYPGWDTADVLARVNAALTDYLNPALWGARPGTGEIPDWLNDSAVRYLEIANIINNIDGVNFITALTIGVQGGALAAADVALTGPAPLPQVGTLTGVVNAP